MTHRTRTDLSAFQCPACGFETKTHHSRTCPECKFCGDWVQPGETQTYAERFAPRRLRPCPEGTAGASRCFDGDRVFFVQET